MTAESAAEAGAWAPPKLHADCETDRRAVAHVAHLARVAVGRLGCIVSPWLDEGLLLGEALHMLLKLFEARYLPRSAEDQAIARTVDHLRRYARASSWYRSCWPCRIAPLCASLVERGPVRASEIAADLGVPPHKLTERFVEAGLFFAVSPQLMIPASGSVTRRIIEQSVGALPATQRRVLALYFRERLSFPEVAELLGRSPRAVQGMYGRAGVITRVRITGGWPAWSDSR